MVRATKKGAINWAKWFKIRLHKEMIAMDTRKHEK
jgi:hypothetical protein